MIISFSSLIIPYHFTEYCFPKKKKTDYYYLIILPYIYHLIFISFPEEKLIIYLILSSARKFPIYQDSILSDGFRREDGMVWVLSVMARMVSKPHEVRWVSSKSYENPMKP